MDKVRKKEKKNSRKYIIIIVIILLICIAIFCSIKFFRGNNSDEKISVPVQSVSVLTGADNTSQNRFSGIVVAQNTIKINKKPDRTIKELYVEVGDTVTKGQKLFEYETDDISVKIEKENLEVERMQNAIENNRKQIDAINSEKAANPGADHSSYNLEIQTYENENRQTEYNIKSKNVEINNLRKQLKNVVVKSEIDGVIQSINETEAQTPETYGPSNDDTSYITIMETGSYRIKGTINEQNIYSIMPGDKVIIHSRIDDKTWTGTIDNIDTSNPESNNNMNYYGMEDDSMSQSSKYPFYINLDSFDGLMMGQHVYIENDVGQNNKKEGLWIPSYFIIDDGNNAYVWASNNRDKLEKRKIKIGEKDEELEECQILEGITVDDYIAIPSDDLKEGELVEKYDFIPTEFEEEITEDNLTDEMNVINDEMIFEEENNGE